MRWIKPFGPHYPIMYHTSLVAYLPYSTLHALEIRYVNIKSDVDQLRSMKRVARESWLRESLPSTASAVEAESLPDRVRCLACETESTSRSYIWLGG